MHDHGRNGISMSNTKGAEDAHDYCKFSMATVKLVNFLRENK